jgi:hypothetical protein
MRCNVPCAIGGNRAEHDLASELKMEIEIYRADYTKHHRCLRHLWPRDVQA